MYINGLKLKLTDFIKFNAADGNEWWGWVDFIYIPLGRQVAHKIFILGPCPEWIRAEQITEVNEKLVA